MCGSYVIFECQRNLSSESVCLECVLVRAVFKSSLACFAWQWIFVTFTFSTFFLITPICVYVYFHCVFYISLIIIWFWNLDFISSSFKVKKARRWRHRIVCAAIKCICMCVLFIWKWAYPNFVYEFYAHRYLWIFFISFSVLDAFVCLAARQ